MLHLLPLRLILWAFAFVAAVSLGLAVPSAGAVVGDDRQVPASVVLSGLGV